jgi:glycosyltransferase involved in cell wall biosynthesis
LRKVSVLATAQRPRISIVTPSFNQAKFIEQTIDSVLSQGYPNLEYIVIDGGSKDGSVDIIRRHERHLAYWTSQKDNGAADAIRNGFERSTGSILAYLNSDDVYMPRALDAIAEVMEDPAADVVFGNLHWIDDNGRVLGEQRQTPFSARSYLYGGSTLQQPATFWKRELYQKCGGITPSFRFAFDTDLFFRFTVSGARFKYLNRFVASFRIHTASKSSNELDICSVELTHLRQKYLPAPFYSMRGRCIRLMGRLQRTFWYIVQGDSSWLLSRIPDRIRARKSTHIVGPRGRFL